MAKPSNERGESMHKLNSVAISAALILASVAPTSALATLDFGRLSKTDSYVKQAFTLEEMNCFSSDIHALEPTGTPSTTPADQFDMLLASGSSGTNGIPCNPRDPKAPPKKKRLKS